MNSLQLTAFKSNQTLYSLPFPLNELEVVESYIFLNKKVAYSIENVSYEYDTRNDVIIKDHTGNDIGVLLFLKNKEFNVSLLNEYQFVSLLIDVDNENTLANTNYTFKTDYVVIDEQYFLDYEYHLRKAAPIWGKFNHDYAGVTISTPTQKAVPFVTAIELQGFNHNFYFESAIRGLQQFYPIERFLKYYHLLELNFDFDLIRRIKNLNVATESHKIGKLLREYEPKEFTRLIYLFDTYCKDIIPIVAKLNVVAVYPVISREMLFLFGKKDSNPFVEDHSKFLDFTNNAGLFSFTNYQTFIKRTGTPEEYRKFMGRVTMYIIYRIRNSIAHNKIGEYVLSSTDQEFVSDFGEPLLLEVLKQLFRS